jgi:hypothetical protein
MLYFFECGGWEGRRNSSSIKVYLPTKIPIEDLYINYIN